MLGPALGSELAEPTHASLALCEAGDDALRPVFEALASNTTLRTLHLNHNALSAPFARDVVLPSVRANTSLRVLWVVNTFENDPIPELVKAEDLVLARI